MNELLLMCFVTPILVLTVLSDFKNEKIPNSLLLILLIINTLFNLNSIIFMEPMNLALQSHLLKTGECILFFIILFPFFSIGALGAGDIKLIFVTSLGLSCPLKFFKLFLAYAFVQAVIKMISEGNLGRVKNLFYYIKNCAMHKKLLPYENTTLTNDRMEHSIHLSLSIVLAAITEILLAYGSKF